MQKIAERAAAAMAAVQYYLEREEAEAAVLQHPVCQPVRPPAAEPGAWAQSGLVDMMTGRRMIQMRAFSVPR